MASYPRQRSGDRWELRAYVGKHPETGKPDFLYGTFHGGARGAKAAQAELVRRAAAVRGEAAPMRKKSPAKQAHERTFADAAEAWFEWMLPKMEPNGRDNVRQILDDYLLPKIATVQLWRFRGELDLEAGDDFDPLLVDLTELFQRMTVDGGKRGGPLSPNTIKSGPARVARAVFSRAVQRNWMAENPMSTCRLPHVPRRPPTVPPAEVMFPFLGFIMDFDPELYAFVELLNSGARRVDMGVTWEEWDPVRSEITLGARGLILARPDEELELPLRGGRRAKRVAMVRETPTSKRRLRKAALDAAANAALKAHRAQMLELALAAGLGGLDPAGFIFAEDAAGEIPRRPDWASHAFADAREAAMASGLKGLAKVRLYDVRHFMATELYSAGIEVAVLAKRMGNSPATIDAYYSHRAPAKDREAADVMAELRAQALAGRPATARARGRGPKTARLG